MAQVKNTPQESVEKKFKDVFERSPGAFPEGTSLEDKVKYIKEKTNAQKAAKSKELGSKMKNVAKLSKELERRQRQNDEEIDKLRRSTQELRKEFGTSKRSRSGGNDKSLQEAANTLRETTTEGKNVEQSEQKKTFEASAQTDIQAETPSKHDVSLSMSKSPTKEKSSNKKPELDKKDNTPQPQENQKEEGVLSLLKRFVKKILEKLLGEDEKSVENARGMKEDAQKDTSNNEEQQKSMDQSSFININGKEFNLEPEKAFNYQDKALNISITYNGPETKQNLQQDTTSPNITNAINLNINGKEYNVQPGEPFNYKSPGLEISVVNGHQQSKNFDKILSQDQSISKGLEQATQLENPAITPVNTPKVDEVNTGRGR